MSTITKKFKGPTARQEKLLCKFIEENPKVIKGFTKSNDLEKIRAKWQIVKPQINACGPVRSYDDWTEYLFEVMAGLNSKNIEWKCGPTEDTLLVSNTADFSELELRMLQLWTKDVKINDSPDPYLKDHENDIEHNRDSVMSNKHPSLNLATGGNEPLLQMADVAQYAAIQHVPLAIRIEHTHFDDEGQDEFDVFGKSIARQLRQMPAQAALETQRIVMSILRKKRMGPLNRSFPQY